MANLKIYRELSRDLCNFISLNLVNFSEPHGVPFKQDREELQESES